MSKRSYREQALSSYGNVGPTGGWMELMGETTIGGYEVLNELGGSKRFRAFRAARRARDGERRGTLYLMNDEVRHPELFIETVDAIRARWPFDVDSDRDYVLPQAQLWSGRPWFFLPERLPLAAAASGFGRAAFSSLRAQLHWLERFQPPGGEPHFAHGDVRKERIAMFDVEQPLLIAPGWVAAADLASGRSLSHVRGDDAWHLGKLWILESDRSFVPEGMEPEPDEAARRLPRARLAAKAQVPAAAARPATTRAAPERAPAPAARPATPARPAAPAAPAARPPAAASAASAARPARPVPSREVPAREPPQRQAPAARAVALPRELPMREPSPLPWRDIVPREPGPAQAPARPSAVPSMAAARASTAPPPYQAPHQTPRPAMPRPAPAAPAPVPSAAPAVPLSQEVVTSAPAQQAWSAPPAQQAWSAPPAQQAWSAPPAQQAWSAPPAAAARAESLPPPEAVAPGAPAPSLIPSPPQPATPPAPERKGSLVLMVAVLLVLTLLVAAALMLLPR